MACLMSYLIRLSCLAGVTIARHGVLTIVFVNMESPCELFTAGYIQITGSVLESVFKKLIFNTIG